MEVLVSEADIVKHYDTQVSRHYDAFRKFEQLDENDREELSRREIAEIIGLPLSDANVWRSSVRSWRKGVKPTSVKSVDFLRERRLIPLTTESPALGIMSYLAGLNWYSGAVHTPNQGQPASCPQFYLSRPRHLDEIAKALDMRLNHSKSHRRYTLPSYMTLLFSELGLPSNGSKASSFDAFPTIAYGLHEQEDHVRLALFLGAQSLTRVSRHAGRIYLNSIDKEDERGALDAAEETRALYKAAFPGVKLENPKVSRNRKKKYNSSFRIARQSYFMLREMTHECIEKEIKQYLDQS